MRMGDRPQTIKKENISVRISQQRHEQATMCSEPEDSRIPPSCILSSFKIGTSLLTCTVKSKGGPTLLVDVVFQLMAESRCILIRLLCPMKAKLGTGVLLPRYLLNSINFSIPSLFSYYKSRLLPFCAENCKLEHFLFIVEQPRLNLYYWKIHFHFNICAHISGLQDNPSPARFGTVNTQ